MKKKQQQKNTMKSKKVGLEHIQKKHERTYV